MPILIQRNGTWTNADTLNIKDAGVWKQVNEAYIKQAGAWVLAYAAEVVAVVTNSINNLSIQSLFAPDDWASTTKKKRVVINAGVTVGSTNAGTPALQTGTARGSILTIENKGTIAGAGGAANGGAGGHAMNVQQASVTVINTGNIYGGGGGGGLGGQGGTGGAGNIVSSERQPASGFSYTAGGSSLTYWNRMASGNQCWIRWQTTGGTGGAGNYYAGSDPYSTITTFTAPDGWTYLRGALMSSYQANITWSIARERTVNTPTNGEAGGTGGNGGSGQGSNVAQANGVDGAGGAVGGTNAGTGGQGGTGGNGGSWGQAGTAGATGNTGSAGNAGGGSAGAGGAAGGAAGAAITGVPRTLQNTGTILGAY